MAQPKPRLSEHHTHIMEAWGSDPRFTRCTQTGCQYAEANGRPVRGPKERSRAAEDQLEQPDLFGWDELDAARWGRPLGWG